MKRNVPTTPAPVPPSRRAPKAQAAQASLFAPEPGETDAPPAPAKPRSCPASRPPAAVPAADPVNASATPVKKSPAPASVAASSKTAVKNAKPKIAKPRSSAKPAVPREQPVRVVNDPVFEGGSLWKMNGRNGVAYIKDAALAGELLAIEPKKLAQAAMAVYYDKKGKAFAWQVRFDTDRWDELMRRLG